MPAIKDIAGQRFGKLLVIEQDHSKTDKVNHRFWRCQCDCGNLKTIREDAITRGQQSCGCLRFVKHGHYVGYRGTPTYYSWRNMIARCRNPDDPAYKNYGGRGIQVCDRWHSFANFVADLGDKPKGYSIERIDNDGNYEPSNCKWIPRAFQSKNRREVIARRAGRKARQLVLRLQRSKSRVLLVAERRRWLKRGKPTKPLPKRRPKVQREQLALALER